MTKHFQHFIRIIYLDVCLKTTEKSIQTMNVYASIYTCLCKKTISMMFYMRIYLETSERLFLDASLTNFEVLGMLVSLIKILSYLCLEKVNCERFAHFLMEICERCVRSFWKWSAVSYVKLVLWHKKQFSKGSLIFLSHPYGH